MKKKLNCNYMSCNNIYVFGIFFLSIFTTSLFSIKYVDDKYNKLENKYTTNSSSEMIFSQKISGLNDNELDKFILGKSFFKIPWVLAPSSTTARDGLGPLYSSNTCISCHPNNGPSKILTKNNNISRGYISKLSIQSNNIKSYTLKESHIGFIKEPTYGKQISINGSINVPFEAKPIILYENKYITYHDGTIVTLRKPKQGISNQLTKLQYGNMHKNTSISNRLSRALIGLGLLNSLTDKQILRNQDINDSNNDGISGKANIVYNPKHKDFRVGRFTWKASTSSMIHQVASAAINDMGLTSSYFNNENCTSYQKRCLDIMKKNEKKFDLTDERLEAIAFYLNNLKIPKSIITQKKGEKLFKKIGCARCHIPSFTLNSGYRIKPFTDMLLHDMGDELSDGRNEFLATPNEWRTAPLWGIGKYKIVLQEKPNLLHDGRARSIEEAILWHGGEARMSQKIFVNLHKKQREQIIKYIEEL